MSAVGFVLLIMCANLANLMLVRGASRQRELAVRAAMGAGRGRLLWATLAETILIAVPGAAHRIADVAVGCRRDDRRIPGELAAVLARLHHRWTRRALFDRRRDLHDAHGGSAAGVAHGAAESRQRSEGRRGAVCRSDRRPAPAGRPRRRAGGALFRVARRRQPDGAELPRHAADQPRIRRPADLDRRRVSRRRRVRRPARRARAFYRQVVDTLRVDPGRGGRRGHHGHAW